MPLTPDSNGKITITDDTELSAVTVATYQNYSSTDVHSKYPISMSIYLITGESGNKSVTELSTADSLLQYAGVSIRCEGNPGMRIEYGIPETAFSGIASDNGAAYTIEEAGTVAAWASTSITPVLGCTGTMSAYAYNRTEAYTDSLGTENGLWKYANAFTFTSLERTKTDLAIRPYIVLSTPDGDRITIYGGVSIRSIGYVAYQCKDEFPKESKEYSFIHSIIDYAFS